MLLSLLALNATVVNEGVYQLLVHIWLKVMVFLTATSFNLTLGWGWISILEVAVKAPCFNNNQRRMQKRLFWRLRLVGIAIGCMTVLQAARLLGLGYSVALR